MSRIPVMLLCHTLGIGGSERQLAETAKALDPDRFEVHAGAFHTHGLRGEELKAKGIPVIEIPVRSFASASIIAGARELRSYVKGHGIRLLHSFDVPLNIFLAFTFPFGPRPVILTSQRGHRSLAPPLHRRLVRVSDHVTDGVVVNCEFMRRHLIEEEHVRAGLIDVCYNGIDTERFAPGLAENVPEPIRCGDPIVGTVCALRREKSLPTLLRAFMALLAERPQSRLLILGSGPEEAALKRLADELGIARATLFAPAARNVVPWLRMMDIFVLPSVSEALSNAIIEAMACGVGVAASRVGGNPELTGESERGFLFTPGDPEGLAALLIRLAADADARQSKTDIARKWIVQNLSIRAMAERMGEIYDKRLARQGIPS